MTEQDEARDRLHRELNYKLCTAIDLTKLGIVLDQMIDEKVLHPNVARTFSLQARALLASMRNANNQAFGLDPQTPILGS